MADDMSNNNFGSTLHHSHVIRDYNKIKNNEVLINQLDSIGLFFLTPALLFLPNPESDSDQHFVSRTSKRLFCVVFRALAWGRTTFPFEARHFVWNLLTCRKFKMILAMIQLMWCPSCCQNTCVTYFFKRSHRMCWKEICTASDSRGCVWKWWFTWISYEHGHKLVMSGDNDNDDKPTDFEVPKPHKQNGFGTLKTLIVVASVVSDDIAGLNRTPWIPWIQ